MNLKKFLEELEIYTKYFSPEMSDFYYTLKEKESKSKLTDNGIKILKCMQENEKEYNNIFTSKNLGELLIIAPRSVSGSIRGLINGGYVEKIATTPITYKLTEQGLNYEFDND